MSTLMPLLMILMLVGCGADRRQMRPSSSADGEGGDEGGDEDGAEGGEGEGEGSGVAGGESAGEGGGGEGAGEGGGGQGGVGAEGEGEGEGGGAGAGGDDGEIEPLPDRCVTGLRWAPGTQAFVDSTQQWGMEELGVVGILVNVIDLEGDGWSDLIVHQEGGEDDFGPEGIRTTWVLRNTGAGRFEDVTESSGFRARRAEHDSTLGRAGQVMASADVDNDGDLDVYTAAWVHEPDNESDRPEILLNNGDGTFILGMEASGIRRQDQQTFAHSLAFVDYDRDGAIDLWMVNNGPLIQNPTYFQDELYRGFGDGDFEVVTWDAGLETWGWLDLNDLNRARAHSWGWAATACDLNNDGITELLAASYGRMPNHLWQGVEDDEGAVSFINRSIESGYAFDEDQYWQGDNAARCYCAENPEAAQCDTAEPPPPGRYCDDLKAALGQFRWDHNVSRQPLFTGGVSASTVCADVDNDGHLDLLTGEIVHPDVKRSADKGELLLNTGDADVRLVRPGNEVTGLKRHFLENMWDEGVMNNAVFDFDNDGWQDVYWSVSGYPLNQGLLFHQDAPATFTPVAAADGWELFHSHGMQAVDIDRDGDLDAVVTTLDSYCGPEWGGNPCYDPPTTRIFENVFGNNNNWLQVKLEGGAGTNRAAIGARVSVQADGLTRTQEVDGGHGRFGTQNDLVLHFGLGEACEAEVTVRWPDRDLTTETRTLAAGYRYHWVQGASPSALPPPVALPE
jgi:hypothetical protein